MQKLQKINDKGSRGSNVRLIFYPSLFKFYICLALKVLQSLTKADFKVHWCQKRSQKYFGSVHKYGQPNGN